MRWFLFRIFAYHSALNKTMFRRQIIGLAKTSPSTTSSSPSSVSVLYLSRIRRHDLSSFVEIGKREETSATKKNEIEPKPKRCDVITISHSCRARWNFFLLRFFKFHIDEVIASYDSLNYVYHEFMGNVQRTYFCSAALCSNVQPTPADFARMNK